MPKIGATNACKLICSNSTDILISSIALGISVTQVSTENSVKNQHKNI